MERAHHKTYELIPFKHAHVGIERGGGGGPDPLKTQNIGFLSNIGPDPLENHKAYKPAFSVGPPSARQRNAILMAFRWRADDDPLIVVIVSSLPSVIN